jgi:hypothetical protein
MRRVGVGLACAVGLLAVAACDSADQPAVEERAAIVGSLCERVQPTLAGTWKAEDAPATLWPLSDSCWLTDSMNATNRFRVSVSVLPTSAKDAADIRKAEAAGLAGFYAATQIAGGVGQESWAMNPAAVGPWLVFRSGDRLVRIAQDTTGQLDAVRAVASTIISLPGGIPEAPAAIARPECAPGTAAAEKVLGAKATARRDAMVDGFAHCLWGSTTSTAYTRAGGPASDQGLDFTYTKDAGSRPGKGYRSVKVGSEGWQQPDGFTTYRVGEDTFVNVGATPAMRPAQTLALAQAILPAYSG